MAIFYTAASCDIAGTQQPAYAEIEGAPAQALRRWLSEHVIDLMVQAEGDARAQPDRAAEGTREQAIGAPSDASRLAQIHGGGPAPRPAEAADQPFYGAARMQQLRGARASPATEVAGGDASEQR